MPEKKDVADAYQALLRTIFPDVVVRHDSNNAPYPDVYDVFFVADDRMADFGLFVMDRLNAMREDVGLPDVSLIAHSQSATREHYPNIVREAALHAKSEHEVAS